MANVNRMACCGLREIDDLSSNSQADRNLWEIIDSECSEYGGWDLIRDRNSFDDDCFKTGALIFTEANGGKYGRKLADLIIKLNLGHVHEVPQFVNLNTGNNIRMYVWMIDRPKIKEWWDANPEIPRVRKTR